MRALTKVVVFARVNIDRKTVQRPVAVFAGQKQALPFARQVLAAYKAKDADALRTLHLDMAIAESGEIHAGLRLSVAELPYNPDGTDDSSDPFADDSVAAS